MARVVSPLDFARRIENPARGFSLYLPADASRERRIAQRKYERAVDELTASGDDEDALAEVRRARRNYGAILLREDKKRRPHIYAK